MGKGGDDTWDPHVSAWKGELKQPLGFEEWEIKNLLE